MNNTLVMEVYKTFEYLTNVNGNEILGELSKSFAYVVQGPIFAESTKGLIKSRLIHSKHTQG